MKTLGVILILTGLVPIAFAIFCADAQISYRGGCGYVYYLRPRASPVGPTATMIVGASGPVLIFGGIAFINWGSARSERRARQKPRPMVPS
jgi:hypothetical protein